MMDFIDKQETTDFLAATVLVVLVIKQWRNGKPLRDNASPGFLRVMFALCSIHIQSSVNQPPTCSLPVNVF